MPRMRLIFAMATAAFLALITVVGCLLSPAPTPPTPTGPFTLTPHTAGNPAAPIPVQPDSPLAHELNRLMATRASFHADYITYAPGLLFRDAAATYNVLPTKLIVNYSSAPGRAVQVSAPITPDEYAALRSLIPPPPQP